MKYTKDMAFKMLADLGVSRWDTNPPENGKIRWYDQTNRQLAEADYKVILSVGPGAMYTMGHAIQTYIELGIPFVEKVDNLPDTVSDLKTDAEVWERAESVGEVSGADFTYQCRTLIVAVFNFRES